MPVDISADPSESKTLVWYGPNASNPYYHQAPTHRGLVKLFSEQMYVIAYYS